ncbi:MAG: hypothetical protein AB1505_08880 [Candidatus Latescibacterota bacterium]
MTRAHAHPLPGTAASPANGDGLFAYTHAGRLFTVPLTVLGSGPTLLVLPPLLGPPLYWLNTTRGVIRRMYCGHVFAAQAAVTRALLESRTAVARAPNARHASVAFVTGALDPFASRAAFLAALAALQSPVLMVVGLDTPPRSRAEMEALAEAQGVQAIRLPGSLGMHEEHAEAILPALGAFLRAPADTR